MIEKCHDTGLRIIEILKILLEDTIDKKSIKERLKLNDNISNAYTNEAYLKYFNTFQELGFVIERKNNYFRLKNALLHIDLTKSEEKILIKVVKAISKIYDNDEKIIFKKLIYKIDKYVDMDLISELNKIEKDSAFDNAVKNIINILKTAKKDKTMVQVTYKTNLKKEETLNVFLKKIAEEKGRYYVYCYNSSMPRQKKICVNSIISVKDIPKTDDNIDVSNTVVFEVYGRLSKSYRLRDWEMLESFGNHFMRIINTKEDYETLFTRLLKYGENCKIISPEAVVSDFLKLTDNVLENLEETVCQK